MNLILLPGNTVSNKAWIEAAEKSLKPNFSSTNIQYYRHWQTGEPLINLDYELEQLVNRASQLTNYSIFAKSAGVILAIRGIYEGKIRPDHCVFVGTPVLWAEEKGFNLDKWIVSFNIATLFIQQENDPVMPVKHLRKYLVDKGVTNCELNEIPGASHDYPEIGQLKEFVLGFLQKYKI